VSIRILQGDCRDVMRTLDEASVDAVVCDPPYELGFMGKSWDASGVAFDPATWAAALRVLKPGGHLLAFSGTRTYHRMVCAIEDAGFQIRDQIGWAFGSGFPKSHNGEWGGTALKPAWEPIVLARKPLIGTVAANWRAHGTGALNIDECRVGYAGTEDAAAAAAAAEIRSKQTQRNTEGWGMRDQALTADAYLAGAAGLGRWPANLLHDGSDEVVDAFPSAPGQQARASTSDTQRAGQNTYGTMARGSNGAAPRGDAGSAARFFYTAKASKHDRNEGLEGLEGRVTDDGREVPADNAYQRGKTERKNHHPTVKPTDLMRYLCRLITPKGGIVLDPFMGSGSTLKAAELEGFSAIGIELDPAYIEIARRRIAADMPLFAELDA
jgi:DNA modification methylase